MIGRFISSAALASAVVLAVGGVASAHIDPDPTEAQAGSRLTVGFTVEHGCDGSPTTQLDMRLPDGVIEAVPEPVEGWDGSVDTSNGDTIITFAGGVLADDVEGTFSVTMTLPPTPDTAIYFPFVQRCEVGEIRWIGIPAEPGDELDEPAPAMDLFGPVAAVPTTVPAIIEPEATGTTEPTNPATSEPAAPDSSTTTVTAEQAPGTTSGAPSTSEPVVIASGTDESGSSQTGTIMFIVSIAAVAALGAFVVYRSRQARAGTTPASG